MSAPYPQRPRRPEPIQFRPEQPTPQGNKVLAWSLRIVGLVAVAVISGLVWWYINSDKQPANAGNGGGGSNEQTTGAYKFTAHEEVPEPKIHESCAEHSYKDVQAFFEDNEECERLTRALYVTKVNGRTIYTSVAVVRMPNEQSAAALRDLTNDDGTGNVKDLVREGAVVIDGLSSLSKSYADKQRGRNVVIVESAFAPGDAGNEEKDKALLEQVSDEALLLADKIIGDSGS